MPQTSFEVTVSSDVQPGEILLVGLSHLGMAGLTAVDYLVRHLPSEAIGHITPEELPAITPFENGTPRHHTRLYNLADHDITVLIGELFVPVWAARPFAEALLEWVTTNGIEEITFLHGVPYPHGPDEHAAFYIAAEPYQTRRLEDTDVQPLKGGFLDGVPAELLAKSLGDDIPPVGVFVTPTHPPGLDIDATVHFLDAIEAAYDVSVDREELNQRSQELKQYYANLAERMQSLKQDDHMIGDQDYPEDSMYM